MVGPRVFTLEEANALIPDLEVAFAELNVLRDQMKNDKVKLNALEMIWGGSLHDEDCPDHGEAGALVESLRKLQEEAAEQVEQIAHMGATVKDVKKGLADLYHVRDGRLVFLCWQRGEDELTCWHHVDEGFADRQPV